MRRRVPLTIALACGTILLSNGARAQGGATISGRVTTEGGAPLSATTVFLQGMSLGATTREDGQFNFIVPPARLTGREATLVARRIGFKEVSVTIVLSAGRITHDFTLSAMAMQLEGLVVTALGVERDKRSLGVAQQSVNAEEIAATRDLNILNSLSGKVAGLEITGTGQTGGSSRIVIRGANSIAGDNQPLFVVDGIPIDNSSKRQNNGVDYGNAAADINPNDIE